MPARDEFRAANVAWSSVVDAWGADDVEQIVDALDLLSRIQHEFNLRGYEVRDSRGELQVGKILDSSADANVINAMRELVGALRGAGVLDGTASVPSIPESVASPESASDATTNN